MVGGAHEKDPSEAVVRETLELGVTEVGECGVMRSSDDKAKRAGG